MCHAALAFLQPIGLLNLVIGGLMPELAFVGLLLKHGRWNSVRFALSANCTTGQKQIQKIDLAICRLIYQSAKTDVSSARSAEKRRGEIESCALDVS
jgi:hypothetical protein